MKRASRILGTGLILCAASGASAQSPTGLEPPELPPLHLLVGYVVNGPEQLLGGGAAWLPGFLGGWGVYVDYKTDHDSPADHPDFEPDRSAEEAQAAGEERSVTTASYRSMNAGLVRALDPQLAVYLGAGKTDASVYSEFFDPTGELGQFGFYWAEYEERGGARVNVMGGLFFRIRKHLGVQLGAEASPAGATVGLHLAL